MNNTMEVVALTSEMYTHAGIILIVTIFSLIIIYLKFKKKVALQGPEEASKPTSFGSSNGCNHNFNGGNGLYCKKCGKRWSKKDES